MIRRLVLVGFAIGAAVFPRVTRADDNTACNAAIAVAEKKMAVPKRVLGTIALVESGRSVGKTTVPWPWSINVGGVGYHYDSKDEAIEAVRRFSAAGQRSIDVGCMQINLLAHPSAFQTLETAFEPAANADYAARFLRSLLGQTGKLGTAMTAYHSQTPEFANDYARRLLAIWPGAADYGLSADPAPAGAPKRKISQVSLDTEAGRAMNGPVTRATSLRGGSWPR